jgi:hypothetical protein
LDLERFTSSGVERQEGVRRVGTGAFKDVNSFEGANSCEEGEKGSFAEGEKDVFERRGTDSFSEEERDSFVEGEMGLFVEDWK